MMRRQACQSHGNNFDSSRVTAAKLNTKNKPELIKKSYARVVKKSCTASLSPRKLQAAMVKASSVEDRSAI